MLNIKDIKGTTLIISYIVVVVLIILGVAFSARSITESRLAQRHKRAIQAFGIAEAGLERTYYTLRKDFENDALDPSWADGEINGIICGPDSLNFYSLPYGSTSLGQGSYSVELKNVPGKDDEIWIRSTGAVGDIQQTLQAYVQITSISPWKNAIFAGTGSTENIINGNVDIRGSVLLLGTNLESDDLAISLSGSGNIGNNYAGIPEQLRKRIPPCPTVMFNGEAVESLGASLRIRRGQAALSGSATIGEPDTPGNIYKETMDGVYVTDGFSGNKGASNVYSDNGTQNSFDLGESVEFPTLLEPYLGYPSYQDYFQAHALVISEEAKLNQLANITPASQFSYSNAQGSISMDGQGNLTIDGLVYIEGGSLNMNMQGADKTITYSGRGIIFATENVGINVNLLTPEIPGTYTFPTNILGIITPHNITFDAANIDVLGLFYAQDRIIATKQTDIAGSLVANYFDMGEQVPSIYQVPEVADYLPAGLIGGQPYWIIKTIAWQKLP